MFYDYRFRQLDPRNTPDAADHNAAIFKNAEEEGIMGIKVTIPALAKRCLFGNLDHRSRATNRLATIDQALTYTLPPQGATLVTTRPDLDSVGAMAVLGMRKAGEALIRFATPSPSRFLQKLGLELKVNGEVRERVISIAIVAALDEEWRPKELPTRDNPWPDIGDGKGRLAALAAAVADFCVPLRERVEMMTRWLISGEEPKGYRWKVEVEREDLIAALENGTVDCTEVGGVARVISTHRAATTIGYSLAPVVVALNPEFRVGVGEPHKKFTICQFKAGYVDLPDIYAELSKREPGWGGTGTIGGSPQGVSSEMSIDDVISVVKKHLLNN